MRALRIVVMTFGYGFITLITLISVMNIINTVSSRYGGAASRVRYD